MQEGINWSAVPLLMWSSIVLLFVIVLVSRAMQTLRHDKIVRENRRRVERWFEERPQEPRRQRMEPRAEAAQQQAFDRYMDLRYHRPDPPPQAEKSMTTPDIDLLLKNQISHGVSVCSFVPGLRDWWYSEGFKLFEYNKPIKTGDHVVYNNCVWVVGRQQAMSRRFLINCVYPSTKSDLTGDIGSELGAYCRLTEQFYQVYGESCGLIRWVGGVQWD